MESLSINILVGCVMSSVDIINEEEPSISFKIKNGKHYKLINLNAHHKPSQENWQIKSIEGDLSNLVGHPVIFATESKRIEPFQYLHETGVFTDFREGKLFNIATNKGPVNILWQCMNDTFASKTIALVDANEKSFPATIKKIDGNKFNPIGTG